MTSCPPRTPWHRGPMLGFDLETTGVDVEQDRVVTAAAITIKPNKAPLPANWLVNPGIEIPKQASDIHGITTEHAHEHGLAPHIALDQIVGPLQAAIEHRTPIVGMNLVYDLTLLDRECRRHGIPTLSQRVEHIAPIIDVLVLDKAMDKYRKGSRNLGALCTHYGVTLDNAHNSNADALASCRLAYKLAQKYPALQTDPLALHASQVAWAREQRASFAAYRAKQGDPLPEAERDGTWPIRPARTLQGAR